MTSPENDFFEYYVSTPPEAPTLALHRDKRGLWRWKVMAGNRTLGTAMEGCEAKEEAVADMRALAEAILVCLRARAGEAEPVLLEMNNAQGA